MSTQKNSDLATEGMNWSKSDISFMKAALKLAKLGVGYTSPNPMVGAIIVRNGKVIAKGYHRRFGGPHAEIEAIRSGGKLVKGATMYVNLEPCSHFGKTPPCVYEIAKAGISRVVISMIDPNPAVAGKGIKLLREKGVEVEIGLLATEAERLNEAYIKYISKGEPFVIMKAAISLDGMIADSNGVSKWISCERSRKLVHRLRREVDSVLVGIETVLTDDPELTVRFIESRRNPRRILLDTRLRVPLEAKILNEKAHTIIVTASRGKKVERLRRIGKEVWVVRKGKDGRVNLRNFLRRAASEGITNILVEGGRRVFSSFLKEKLVDKFYIFIAPRFLGKGTPLFDNIGIKKIEESLQLKDLSIKRIDSDILVVGYPK